MTLPIVGPGVRPSPSPMHWPIRSPDYEMSLIEHIDCVDRQVQNHTPVVLLRSFPTRGKTGRRPIDEEVPVYTQQPSSLDTPLERLLTVEDVARVLGVSKAAVYAMVSRGYLTPVPLPLRKTRFTRDSIDRLLRGEVVAPRASAPGGKSSLNGTRNTSGSGRRLAEIAIGTAGRRSQPGGNHVNASHQTPTTATSRARRDVLPGSREGSRRTSTDSSSCEPRCRARSSCIS